MGGARQRQPGVHVAELARSLGSQNRLITGSLVDKWDDQYSVSLMEPVDNRKVLVYRSKVVIRGCPVKTTYCMITGYTIANYLEYISSDCN